MFRISLRSATRAAAVALVVTSVQASAPAPSVVTSPRAVAAPTPADHPPPLAIGAPAPDFSLPGIDGKTYTLASFKDAKALAVIFTAVHCPTAEIYEGRIKKLVADYKAKGVAFAVIQPNNAKAVRLDEMGYHRPGRFHRGHEDTRRVPRLQLPVPLRWRDAGGDREVRPGRDAAHFRLRHRAHAALPGPHRQQPREVYAKVADARLALDAVLAGARCRSRRRPPSPARSSGWRRPCRPAPSTTPSTRNRCR
ncbi:MAG: redoxin family protein [Vicinamibacteraceae bacterium]